MAIWNEDDANRQAGFGNSVTGAAGSNAAIDLAVDQPFDAIVAEMSRPENLSLDDALKQEHPDYTNESSKWKKYLDLYSSNDIYRFIHRHLREADESWQQRVERGYYFNYCKNVVDLFTAFLFHAPIDRDPGSHSEILEEVYKSADNADTLWNVFWQKVCIFSQVEGHVGILVDAPKMPPGGFSSEQERKDARAKPYLTLLHAAQIIDWEVDQFGEFEWVKIEVFRPQDRSWQQSASERSRFFQIWTKDDWTEYELPPTTAEDARQVDQGTHNLGVVPIVIVKMDDHPTHAWFGQSVITDIADINIGILNWSSLGDEEIFERCLNILAMERGEGDAAIELGASNVLEYEPGTKTPVYLSLNETPLELILKWIKEAKDEIRRLAKLNISTGLGDVRQASSGIAKAFSFVETNQSLAGKALNLEQAETKVHILILRWLDQEFDGSISYPREFGVEDILTLFQELDAARSSLTSETAIKEQEKKVTRKLFAADSMELREEIEKEIEEGQAKPGLENAFGMMSFGQGSEPEDQEEDGPPNQPEAGTSDRGSDPGEATAA